MGWAKSENTPLNPPFTIPPHLFFFFLNNQKNKYLSNDPSLHLVKHSQEELEHLELAELSRKHVLKGAGTCYNL